MTREEKIALLIDELEDIRCDNFDADTDEDKTLKEVVRVIKALEQEPSGDAIDRKLVCAFIDGLISDDRERRKGLEYIRHMPPVTPQPKTGVLG